jgi:hypothetical protein
MKQQSWLHEVAEEFGVSIIHYPRYYCELNYIEMIWCFLKRQLRRNCTFDFGALNVQMPIVLESIPKDFFRKASDHCFTYMQWYRKGLTGGALEYAMRKFKSHRAISVETAAIVHGEFEEYNRKRSEKALLGLK